MVRLVEFRDWPQVTTAVSGLNESSCMQDPYETLGVNRTATDVEIKDAFKRLARKFHPDLHPDHKDAEAKFKDLSAANDFLKDKEKRRRFDAGEIDATGLERPQERASIATSPTVPPMPRTQRRTDLGRSAWRAWLLIALMVSVVLLQLFVQYRLNFWNRDFFNAIGRKDGTELWAQALRFLPIATASVVLAVISVWGRMTTQRTWREWLSDHLYDYWLENGHSRRLRFMLENIKLPSTGSPKTQESRQTCPLISALDCYRRSSARPRLLASSGLLGAIS